tara:strand:+ start:426 stop:638 length:213 start_codon:yes stop_codon:yes gene_type:complete
MNKFEYILLSYSSPERTKKRMAKNSMNVKRIKAKSELEAILKRNKYLKNIDADLSNFRWSLYKQNGMEVA